MIINLPNRRKQLIFFLLGTIVLSMTAEKCRELVGEEAASKSGKFTILNCFDMGSGSLACGVKEGIKLYVYSIRSAHVKKVQQRAMEVALTDALTDGLSSSAAAKQAQKIGDKAAKLARRKGKRIVGPILSSGWDFFEAVYYGGTLAEGVLRGTGTLFGTYIIGYHGEEAFGRFGYLVGSHLGSWIGGRIGLMCYDVVNGINFLVGFVETVEDTISEVSNDYAESSDDESVSESSDENPEASSEGWGFF